MPQPELKRQSMFKFLGGNWRIAPGVLQGFQKPITVNNSRGTCEEYRPYFLWAGPRVRVLGYRPRGSLRRDECLPPAVQDFVRNNSGQSVLQQVTSLTHTDNLFPWDSISEFSKVPVCKGIANRGEQLGTGRTANSEESTVMAQPVTGFLTPWHGAKELDPGRLPT